MSDLIDNACAWLGTQRKAYASRTVTYSRAGITVSVLGTKGKTEAELSTENDLLIDASIQDWLIDAEDLVLNGVAVQPADGDTIAETVGTSTVTWEVRSPGDPEPTWRWADSFRRTYRIHTVEVS